MASKAMDLPTIVQSVGESDTDSGIAFSTHFLISTFSKLTKVRAKLSLYRCQEVRRYNRRLSLRLSIIITRRK